MPCGITQCYLPPGRGENPTFTPSRSRYGTRFSNPDQPATSITGKVAANRSEMRCREWRPLTCRRWAAGRFAGTIRHQHLCIFGLHGTTLCVCTVTDFSAAAPNFARWFISVLGRESPILANFAPPEGQKSKVGRIGHPDVNISVDMRLRKLHARDVPFVEYRAAAYGRKIGMCGYTAVPEDGRTCYYYYCIVSR